MVSVPLSPGRPSRIIFKNKDKNPRSVCGREVAWKLSCPGAAPWRSRGGAQTPPGDHTSQHCHLCFRTKPLPSSGSDVLTRLSSIRMRASNSCSPISHLGGDPVPSPAGDPGERDLALYFPGSRRTKLSGPPALVRVRTFSKTSRHYSWSALLRARGSGDYQRSLKQKCRFPKKPNY